MADKYYPTIDKATEIVIKRIANLYGGDKNYLDYPECPYPEDVKDIFKGTAMYHDFDSHKIDEVPSSNNILANINKLTQELRDYGTEIHGSSESKSADKNTYFRLSVTLIKELVEARERLSKISQFEFFTEKVLTIMEKVLTSDQRNAVMSELEGVISDNEPA